MRGFALLLFCAASATFAAPLQSFVQKYCVECHDNELKKGGLDLASLPWDPEKSASIWTKVHDRVASGEMPPPKKPRPEASDLKSFTNFVGKALLQSDREAAAREGRGVKRRLNRYEYEETLRELLGLPYLEVKNFLPEDRESHLFNKVGEALDVSHVQVARYLAAAEFALRQAMVPQAERPEIKTNRIYTMEDRAFFGKINLGPPVRSGFPLVGLEMQNDIINQKPPRMPMTQDPERRSKEAMAYVVSTYEPTEIRFSGFRAPVSGRYKLRFSAYSIQMAPDYKSVSRARRSEPVTVYAEVPPQNLRRLASFDVGPEPTEVEIEAWLIKGETIRPDAARLHRSRPPDHKNPDMGPDGAPGVAFQWMEWTGPIFDQWPTPGHRLMFGELPIEQEAISPATGQGEGGRRRGREPLKSFKISAIPRNPAQDAERLLRGFMARAYRAPVEESDVQRFLALISAAMAKGHSFTEAMITGYTAVLSSPGFLYFQDKPGRLDDIALAERLSYFLWNSAPDDQLRAARLRNPKVLRAQTERLLNDPRSAQFIRALLDYWLDLRNISGVAPDEQLYPDYQLDDHLAESMIEESRAFFAELLGRNLSVTNIVDSDFVTINERLATHYGIPDVKGVQMRRVSLPRESMRGGFLTSASVLKVTSGGAATSPIKRGAWIMTRIIGRPPPPPPEQVPTIEPDIRGATTIREQLAKHRSQESCNVCHRNIDPAGFALESFDVMGGWRDRYRTMGGTEKVKGIGHNGNYFHFSLGPNVDATGELPDGRKFDDIRQLKQCLAADPDQLARNLARHFVVYATGAPIRFSDRPVIEKMLAENRKNGYGVRDLVHQVVQSELFLNK